MNPRRALARILVPLLAVTVLPGVTASPAQAYSMPVDLGALTASGVSEAKSINLHEDIVGTSDNQPVIWLNRRLYRLPLPAGATGDQASDINSSGTVVGYIVDASGY
jgi:hypothetical protein